MCRTLQYVLTNCTDGNIAQIFVEVSIHEWFSILSEPLASLNFVKKELMYDCSMLQLLLVSDISCYKVGTAFSFHFVNMLICISFSHVLPRQKHQWQQYHTKGISTCSFSSVFYHSH